MGILVNVEPGADEVLDKLRSSPDEVFGTPYSGYLLFLVGGADEAVLTWTLKNATALDSLTGDDIAFAIFARNFKMRVHGSNSLYLRDPRTIEIPLHEIKASSVGITDLIKSGEYGWIQRGDQLDAITFAVDDLARGFGVVGDLPCLLILDAVPKEEVVVFRLDGSSVDHLIPLLRRVIQDIRSIPNYPEFKEAIDRAVQLQKDLAAFDNEIGYLLHVREGTTPDRQLVRSRSLVEELRQELVAANVNRFTALTWELDRTLSYLNFIGFGSTTATKDKLRFQPDHLINQVRESQRVLLAQKHTARTLSNYGEGYQWPLEEPSRSRYQEVYRKYVHELIAGIPNEPDLHSPEQCHALTQQLREQQGQLVEHLMSQLPSASTIEDLAERMLNERRDRIDSDIEKLNEKRSESAAELRMVATHLFGIKQPSLMRSFEKEAGKERFTSVKRRIGASAIELAGSWLRPDVLLDTWKAFFSI